MNWQTKRIGHSLMPDSLFRIFMWRFPRKHVPFDTHIPIHILLCTKCWRAEQLKEAKRAKKKGNCRWCAYHLYERMCRHEFVFTQNHIQTMENNLALKCDKNDDDDDDDDEFLCTTLKVRTWNINTDIRTQPNTGVGNVNWSAGAKEKKNKSFTRFKSLRNGIQHYYY